MVDADSGNILKFTSANRWTDKATATDIYNKVKDTGSAIITKVATKRKVEKAPLLYDLTTLQKEANSQHGFTAEHTLSIAQKLYEAKFITIQEHQAAIFRMMYLPPFPNSSRIWRIIRNLEKK